MLPSRSPFQQPPCSLPCDSGPRLRLARRLRDLGPSPLARPRSLQCASGAACVFWAAARVRRRLRSRLRARGGCRSDTFRNLETLAATLQLAERSGDKEGAVKLREQLQDAEASNPVAALAWRQNNKLQVALDTVLLGVSDPIASRIEAVCVLEQLASPPLARADAEEALYRILREVSGKGAEALREAAEESLWACWHASDDEDVAAAMRQGSALMEGERMQEALQVFSEVVDMAPDFAEAWNKRATVLYMLKEHEKSIEDCERVLELKPKHFGCLSGLGMCYAAMGESKMAAKWYKEALKVHPSMRGPRAALDRIERQGHLETHLAPLLSDGAEALREGSYEATEKPDSLAVHWDVHNVLPRGGVQDDCVKLYFFRVCLRNKAVGTRAIRSLGRFYVLQFAGGGVVPLMRPTAGAAEFILEPGEEYRYAWAFTVSKELVGMIGGMLLERMDKVCESDQERFITLSLDNLPFTDAPAVPMNRVEDLCNGHYYMGQLDLRDASQEMS